MADRQQRAEYVSLYRRRYGGAANTGMPGTGRGYSELFCQDGAGLAGEGPGLDDRIHVDA